MLLFYLCSFHFLFLQLRLWVDSFGSVIREGGGGWYVSTHTQKVSSHREIENRSESHKKKIEFFKKSTKTWSLFVIGKVKEGMRYQVVFSAWISSWNKVSMAHFGQYYARNTCAGASEVIKADSDFMLTFDYFSQNKVGIERRNIPLDQMRRGSVTNEFILFEKWNHVGHTFFLFWHFSGKTINFVSNNE